MTWKVFGNKFSCQLVVYMKFCLLISTLGNTTIGEVWTRSVTSIVIPDENDNGEKGVLLFRKLLRQIFFTL